MIGAYNGMVLVDARVMAPEIATKYTMQILAAIDAANAQREHANGEVPDPEIIAAEKRLANRDAQRRRRANAIIKQLAEETTT